jgi:protein-S-isoprenylcysteine O-methyltransferase Ste14
MTTMGKVELAERKASARAAVMALLAVVLAGTATFGFDNPVNDMRGRAVAWLVELGLALMVLGSGGGLMLSRELRALMNDELSRDNRRRAIVFGFYAGLVAMTALYVAAGIMPIDLRAAFRLASGLAIAAALGRYAMLEWR